MICVSRKLRLRCTEVWRKTEIHINRNRDTWLLRLLVQLIRSMILVVMMSWHRQGPAISSYHLRRACLKCVNVKLAAATGHATQQTSCLPVTRKEIRHWWFRIIGPVCQRFYTCGSGPGRDRRRSRHSLVTSERFNGLLFTARERADYIGPRPRARPRGHGEFLKPSR